MGFDLTRAFAGFRNMIDIEQDLNPQQREAVLHAEGPLLVVAGAGTGKTRVITYRIAHLIARGVPPEAILAVTFTNKAAEEMRERVRLMVSRSPVISTFHSFCVRVLRAEIHQLGRPSDFVIYDEDDSLRLMKQTVEELELDPERYAATAVLQRIGFAKNRLEGPERFAGAIGSYDRDIGRLFERYQADLVSNNALDFDDLLSLTVQLFRTCPDVLRAYQERYRHLLVDEYQDTNLAQYRIIQYMTGQRRDVCVVGDPDQSIYRWRGAELGNILNFERDFPGTRVITLEQNYRSTEAILKCANAVILHNARRKEKDLWTSRSGGPKVAFHLLDSDFAEVDFVVEVAGRAQRTSAARLNQIAVFYRTNAQSRLFEEGLRVANVPYVVVGGVGFYARREIKDLIAYLRVVASPPDSVSLTRIINVPPRGIGRNSVDRLREMAAHRRLSLYEALTEALSEGVFRGVSAKGLRGFVELLASLREPAAHASPSALLLDVMERTGYLKMLEREGAAAEDRVENVKELVTAARGFERENEGATIRDFLEHSALFSDIDDWDQRHDRINLMTAHNSKGLEFPIVVIAGLEEGIFPHASSFGDPEQLEEERRLCYVAMTRAKDRLHLCAATERQRFGKKERNAVSRFVREIPKRLLDERADVVQAFGRERGAGRLLMRSHEDRYCAGDVVVHRRYGRGTVTAVHETPQGEICEIQFETESEPRAIAAKFARLRRI